MYDIYGIVKVEYYSYNIGEYIIHISHIITLIPPKCAKTGEPEDECCVLWCTQQKYIYTWHYIPRQT